MGALSSLKDKIVAGLTWLNAVPGRKRGIALICVGIAAALRAADREIYAQGVEGLNTVIQGLTTTSDIAAAVLGVWGLIAPLTASHATLQKQAINVLEQAQKKMPEEATVAKGLNAEAIQMVSQAKQEAAKVEAHR